MAKVKTTIIHEDDDIIIVNKPSGVLTIPDRFVLDRPNLVKDLGRNREELFVVHRLDRETSGVICFAKNEKAHKHLNRQFQERTVDKFYLALVEGTPYNEEGIIEKPIAESTVTRGKMIIHERGKASLTLYKVLESFKHYSLVSANIKTGRTHQVRIHFASIGHPLASDALYGRKDKIFLSEIKMKKYKRGKYVEEQPLIARTTLHAFQIGIDHPTSGERLFFEAEPPKDLRALLNQLRKWGK